jgi:hypothetical protein
MEDTLKQADLQAKVQRVTRVADANRKRLYLFSRRPQAPRGPKFNPNGYMVWDEPQELRNVTHYNVYAGDDSTLYRRYPVGTTLMNDLTPDKSLIWVASFNEQSGLESQKIQAVSVTASGLPDPSDPSKSLAGPAPNVTGFTASSERSPADENSEMVRLNGSWTLPTDTKNYGGARILGQAAGETSWSILTTVNAKATSFVAPWMPAPRSDTSWTIKVQPINASGTLNVLDSSTATATTTIGKGVGGYDLSKVLAGSYDTVAFNVIGGRFVVTAVDMTKAWNLNASEFDTTGGFHINKLSADKINAGTLKVGGYVGGGTVAGQILIVDNDNYSMLGWIGKSTDNAYRGAWFPLLRVGGSDPSTATLVATSTSLTLKGSSLFVGPGTFGSNGQVWVYNGSNIIAWIGSDNPGGSSTYFGAWFKQLYVGGASPSSAQFYCDAFGNAFFNGSLGVGVTLAVNRITGWNGGSVDVGGAGMSFTAFGYSTVIYGNSINTGSLSCFAGDISIGVAGAFVCLGNRGMTGTLPAGARPVVNGGIITGYV